MTATPDSPSGARYTRQIVVSKTVWLQDKLFSLRVTRATGFEFTPGQFARLGLPLNQVSSGTSLETQSCAPTEWRAYSMVSHPDEGELEFFSVIVPEGKFSPTLARLNPGDTLFIDKTVFGFLTLERFVDGEDLWLIATGTGLSAYISMLRDPNTWTRFKRVIVVHGVRQACELAYRDEILNLRGPEKNLLYLPVTSQEVTAPELSPHLQAMTLPPARLTTLLSTGELEARIATTLSASNSRVMLCGNPAMVSEMRSLLAARGFAPGRRGTAGNLAVENYW